MLKLKVNLMKIAIKRLIMIQYQIFFLKDKDNNDKKYTFHRIDKKYYYLRYTDRNCNGSAKYNTLFAIII